MQEAPPGVRHSRIEGREGYTRGEPELEALAKALKAENGTLFAVSAALAEQGYVTKNGRPFNATQVKRLVGAA